MAKLSIRLKELRSSRGLSQQKFADYIGMSKSSVNMYERGEREPGIETLEHIADFFNVDLDYLVGKSDIPNKSISSNVFSYNSPTQTPLIMVKYNQLNELGQKKLNSYADDLLVNPKYTTSNKTEQRK